MLRHKQFNQSFVNAFDELNDRNRKLFDIPEIDQFLSFENKKNVCIMINSPNSSANSFLNSIITNACTNYHKEDNDKSKRTIMIDAGNGNNLGHIYLELVRQSMKNDFDMNTILNQTIIIRAFTFYQLLNIVINELPKLLLRLQDCKIQVVVLDLLDTLIYSNRYKASIDHWKSKTDFKYNEKLVDEMIDNLIAISKDHFVITWYDNSTWVLDNFSIPSKFSNFIEINSQTVVDEFTQSKIRKEKGQSQNSVIEVRIKSDKTTTNNISISNY